MFEKLLELIFRKTKDEQEVALAIENRKGIEAVIKCNG